jgi:hypothetical protein
MLKCECLLLADCNSAISECTPSFKHIQDQNLQFLTILISCQGCAILTTYLRQIHPNACTVPSVSRSWKWTCLKILEHNVSALVPCLSRSGHTSNPPWLQFAMISSSSVTELFILLDPNVFPSTLFPDTLYS